MKIRNVAMVTAVFALLAVSVIGIPQPGDQDSISLTKKTTSLIEETNSSKSTNPPASSNNQSSPKKSEPPSTSSKQSVSIVTQVQNSGHANQTEGISCTVCHDQEDDNRLRQTGWETCGSCHVNSSGNPIPGQEVHHPQFQMIQGVAIGDILPMPSYKYKYLRDSFSCTSCHVTNSTKHDFMVPGVSVTEGSTIDFEEFTLIFKQESCDVCHPSTSETVSRVKEIQMVIGEKLEQLKPIYEEWSLKIKSMDVQDPRVQTFKNGATYYTFVNSDGSKGIHNFPYAKALLEKAEKIWKGLSL